MLVTAEELLVLPHAFTFGEEYTAMSAGDHSLNGSVGRASRIAAPIARAIDRFEEKVRGDNDEDEKNKLAHDSPHIRPCRRMPGAVK